MQFTLWALLAAGAQAQLNNFYPCPVGSATYPKPTGIANASIIQAAIKNTTSVVEQALSAGLIDNEETAFSLLAFSTSDPDSTPFYTYHRTPPILANTTVGVKEVNSNTVYRLGSISKIITVYTLLVADGFKNFQSTINQFVPRLSGHGTEEITSTDWDDITLQALASHMGGIGTEYGALDIATSPFPYTKLGLPKPPASQIPPCDGPPTTPLCTKQQFITGILNKHPVFQPFYAPSYSNVGFGLLGNAIESITGQSFPDAAQSKVLSPLGMNRTSFYKPNDSIGVIPGDPSVLLWNSSQGNLGAAAAFYSTPHDLAVLGRAVLSSQQLTPVQTRRWMKPLEFTSDPGLSVGAPWEISRYTLPSDPYRIVDLYAKAGEFGAYTGEWVLVPDYNVGFSVNVAGATNVSSVLANIVAESFVPALEELARQQAQSNFAGHYVSSDKRFSFLLNTTQGAPGLHLTNFTGPQDTNEFATIAVLALVAAGSYDMADELVPLFTNGSASEAYEQGFFGVEIDLRLFPTMLRDNVKQNGGTSRISFRAAAGESVLQPPGPFTSPCQTWETLDTVTLGGASLDEFIFDLDSNGNAVAIWHPFLRTSFERMAM